MLRASMRAGRSKNSMSNLRRSFFILSLCAVIIGAHADDTDVYLNPSVPSGAEPQICSLWIIDQQVQLPVPGQSAIP